MSEAVTRRVPRRRVLLLVENAPVPADRRVWNEARTLRQAGYQVSIICPQRRWRLRHERLEGISIYRFPLPSLAGIGGHLLEYAIALPMMFVLTCWVFFYEGFDVIHAANPPDFLYLIARVFKRLGKKFVFDQHDVGPEACTTRWSGIKRRLTYALAVRGERASFRTAAVVIAVNESVRRMAIDRGRVDPTRVFVVRDAIRTADFSTGQPRAELRRGKRYLVCYAGVIGPDDGLGELLLAARHVVLDRLRSDVHFVVIGDGDCFESIVQMSHRLGLDGSIEFTGWLRDDSAIANYLATADVCVVPDPKNPVNDLCSMNKIVEYMAMGKPVVAFDLKEARETAREAGVYVTPNGERSHDAAAFGDQILTLLDSPQTRARMGRLGRQRFTQVLAWDHQQAALLQAYAALFPAPLAYHHPSPLMGEAPGGGLRDGAREALQAISD